MSSKTTKSIFINRQILNLSIPNIITNITVPLVGMVDIALMGHLANPVYIGAIALGSMIFNLLYSGVIFLRMGTSGFTAQAFGAFNRKEMSAILVRSFMVAQLIAFVLIALQTPIEWLGFKLIDANSNVENLAVSYFRIRIWAAPATLGVYAFTGWFLGMQNAKYPMFVALIINVVNIITSVYFVRVGGMRSDGVALGTVIAQYSGLIASVGFYYFAFSKKLSRITFKDIFDLKALKLFFKVNTDILIRSLLIAATFFYFNAVSAGLGNDILAINAVLLQFFMFFSYFVDGFAFAAEAIVGKYIGANNLKMLKASVNKLMMWGLLLAVAFTVVYLFGFKIIVSLLTNNESLIMSIMDYKLWVVLIPLVSFSAFIWDGIFTGATASSYMRNSMLIAVLLIFVPARYLLVPIIDNHGLWLALSLFLLARGVGLWISYGRIQGLGGRG
jgi:multidrug resistance protein, MATE family